MVLTQLQKNLLIFTALLLIGGIIGIIVYFSTRKKTTITSTPTSPPIPPSCASQPCGTSGSPCKSCCSHECIVTQSKSECDAQGGIWCGSSPVPTTLPNNCKNCGTTGECPYCCRAEKCETKTESECETQGGIWCGSSPVPTTLPPYVPTPTPTPTYPTGTLMTGTNLCFKSDNKSTYWTEQKAPRWQPTCTKGNHAYMQLYLASDTGKCNNVSTLPSRALKDGEIYRMCHIGDGYTKCLFDAAYEDWKDGSSGSECDTTTTNYLQAHWLLYKDGNKGDIMDGDTIWLQTLKESSKDCLGDGASANMHEDFCWTDTDESLQR